MRKLWALLLSVLLPWGCVPHNYRYSHVQLPDIERYKIAVLPFSNETVDFDASPVFRYAVHSYLSYKGYKLPPIAGIDASLTELGISEGGQLSAFETRELGKATGVRLLLYGTVTEFNTKYALVYSSIQVACKFKLVEAETGRLIWESFAGSYSNNFSRIFFVGDVLDLLMTLDLREFITNNDFVRFFEEDYEQVVSEGYLRRNVQARENVPGNEGVRVEARAQVGSTEGRAIMEGARLGVEVIRRGLRDKEAVVAAVIVFLTWTLLYAIFDNYNNYVVDTVVKGFKGFPR